MPKFRLAAYLLLLTFGNSIDSRADFLTSFGSGPNQFSLTFVRIGNPGNAPDNITNPIRPDWYQPNGSVSYEYGIGKYEISRDAISKANDSGQLGITMWNGISEGNKPATDLNWREAATFVNWLNTSQGYHRAYNIQGNSSGYWNDSESWTEGGLNQWRHKDARFFLPTANEWFKAAYYDPNKDGVGGYWTFPTASDSAPTPVASGTDQGTAVWNGQDGPADVDQAGGLSTYGVMGMAGNVNEWEEGKYDDSFDNDSRALRGGSWTAYPAGLQDLSKYYRSNYSNGMNFGGYEIGLRVVDTRLAAVPEPGLSLLVLLFGGISISGFRKRN